LGWLSFAGRGFLLLRERLRHGPLLRQLPRRRQDQALLHQGPSHPAHLHCSALHSPLVIFPFFLCNHFVVDLYSTGVRFLLQVKGLPFNRYSWLVTHNSFSILGEPSCTGVERVTFYNQEHSVTNQLRVGSGSMTKLFLGPLCLFQVCHQAIHNGVVRRMVSGD